MGTKSERGRREGGREAPSPGVKNPLTNVPSLSTTTSRSLDSVTIPSLSTAKFLAPYDTPSTAHRTPRAALHHSIRQQHAPRGSGFRQVAPYASSVPHMRKRSKRLVSY
eukprot:478261-Rhodomonas_salina.2